MCFVLKKHHVRILNDFLHLQLNERIHIRAFAISEEQKFDAFRIQLLCI
jgi:hypothetical protein